MREFYASAKAIKQPAVEFLLKRFDGVTDRRLRDEKLSCCQRKTTHAGERRERE